MIKKINLKRLFILLLPFILLTVSHAISATQSSTYGSNIASRAIDGNTDGNYYHEHTSVTAGATWYDWLLIDLGSVQSINTITLWNRTDGNFDKTLRNVSIMISPSQFIPEATDAGLQNARNIAVWEGMTPSDTTDIITIPFNPGGTQARYILIQKTGYPASYTSYLTLAEVQVSTNTPPIASAGTDQLVTLGDSVTLDASGSSDSDGNIASYLWTEGNTILSHNQNFTLSSLSAGIHTITLTVTDNQGATDTDTVTITVNTPPVANAGSDQNVLLGEEVTLNGSASSDDDLNSMTYTWTQGGNTIATGISPTITFSTAGTYTVTLTVTDNNGLTSSDDVVIQVNEPLEVKDMNFTIIKNTSVSFALIATNPKNVTSYPIITSPTHGSLSGPENNITYTPNTNYTGIDTFTYKASDGTNDSNLGTVTITIVPPATAVHDDYNTTYNTQLNGNVLDNDLGLNLELIDFNTTPNGNLNINSDGSFTYLPKQYFDGNETFSYTIRDELNNTSTTTVTIVVYPPRADLSIVKTAPSESNVNEAIDYTLQIRSNPSTRYITASNVRVIDQLPLGVLYSGVTTPSGWTCSQRVGTVTCNASNIPIGYNGTIIIHAFAPNILGDSTNTAKIASDTIDPDKSNNTSLATTNMGGKAVDLSITKTVSSPTVTTTTSFSYTLNVRNTGSDDTTGVTVTDNLNNTLGFISIDGGTDWSCSQGSSIVCTYIANSGVFVSGGTSNPIVINVRAPSTIETIPNTAEVSSDTVEVNTANNKDSVNVNIVNGNIQTGAINLTKYLQYNLSGDIKLVGNANINKLASDLDNNYNDNINMHYVDTDNNSNTYNSSSSTLTLDSPNYSIKWAGLYWEGHICSIDNAGTSQGANTGCDWSHSPFTNYNDAVNNIGTIKFKTPNSSGYQTITANRTSIIQNSSLTRPDSTYTAFADITRLLASNETGVYSVADMVLTEGSIGSGGNYGGWTMLVIYEDNNQTVQYKNISVFNGFQFITSDGNNLAIDGFLTPKSGTLNASVAFFAGDGDPVVGGVARMRKGKTSTFQPIGDSLSPKTNLFNSTMTELGNNINTGVTKTYGVDANRIDVSDFMVNNQTNTAFKFDVTTPTGGRDHYSLSMFAFATDLTSPVIDNFEKSAVIIDKDGTRRASAPNEPIYPGSSLEYTITFKNTGDEVAQAVEIFDDFDLDGLSQALDNYHFDTTKLKLFNGTTTNNEVTNADCRYDIPDHRVSCKIPSVAIDQSFTMQFIVHVKEDLDASLLNTHAKNTAYAKYRNPNGNTYVKKYTTPITNEDVGGKSNGLNAGTFKPNTLPQEDYISIDAINAGYDYTQDRNITTKIVNSPFAIKLVHVDSNLTNNPYQAWQGSKAMAVIITLDDNATITPPLNDPSISYFNQGQPDITVPGLGLTRAHRNKRLKLLYLDWAKILSWAPSDSACVTNPNNSINLSGMPECFNDYEYVKEIFKPNSYTGIAECYGMTETPPREDAACNPLNYSTGGNKANGTILPKIYNHSFGCYQCIAESLPNFQHYSTDNFAARPDHFVFTSQHPSFPDLLRSGQDYNLSLEAKDGNDDNTLDYNTTSNTLRMDPPTLDPDDLISDNIVLDGNTSIIPTDANISDGVAVDDNGDPSDVVGFTFDNVGEAAVNIYDPNWANVDADDTPRDCNATVKSIHDVPIEGVLSICGSVNTRFIPHHFALTSKLRNHRNGTFTYYANNLAAMSAHVGLTIQAENEQNETTTNFKQGAYEHPITIDVNVTDSNDSYILPNLVLETQVPDSTTPLGFKNGTYTIETNSSTLITNQILFNYKRAYNTPLNPAEINGTEVNTTIQAKYISSKGADELDANITGSTLSDGNATFYYGKVEPKVHKYTKITKDTKKTPVQIKVYCDTDVLGYNQCDKLGIDTIEDQYPGEDNKFKWWLARKHETNSNDGNVTLKVTTSNASISPSTLDIHSNSATDKNVTVSLTAPRDANVTIVLDTSSTTSTSPWLIHNPDADVAEYSPFMELNFPKPKDNGDGNGTGGSSWTGFGKTGHVVDANASTNTDNKRLGW